MRLQVETRAPFGLSRANRTLAADGPDGVLVFPEYRQLEHLDLYDRQPAAETSAARAGGAGEFIGVRDYNPGDDDSYAALACAPLRPLWRGSQ